MTQQQQDQHLHDVLYQSPYLNASQMTPEEEVLSVYKSVPRLSQLGRQEMTKDLIQAYSDSLMSDQERQTYGSYRSAFNMLSLGLGGAVPFAFMLILRPGLADIIGGPRRANIFWAAIGLTGAGAAFLGFK